MPSCEGAKLYKRAMAMTKALLIGAGYRGVMLQCMMLVLKLCRILQACTTSNMHANAIAFNHGNQKTCMALLGDRAWPDLPELLAWLCASCWMVERCRSHSNSQPSYTVMSTMLHYYSKIIWEFPTM